MASDFHYNSTKRELEFHDSEIGISKGRTALDKLGIITYIDYKNIDSMSNQELIKKSLLSFILSLPLETSLEFLKKDCFECDNYLKKRKKIFDIYNNFHNGNLKQGCEDLSLYWKNWIEHPFIKKHSLVIIQQLEENYEILQKKCKKS
jgi:CO dehydrogenase/acetyl-CoA synthase alpha subunit